MSELKGWQKSSRTIHEGCIHCGSLLTSYSARYIIRHTQSGLTHSYCFILTLSVFYLLLLRFLNYFKWILENLVTYDIFLLFISAYMLKKTTKKPLKNLEDSDSFCSCLVVLGFFFVKHCIPFNLPFCHILASCQSFLPLAATPEVFLLRSPHCYTTILQVLTTEKNLKLLAKILHSGH